MDECKPLAIGGVAVNGGGGASTGADDEGSLAMFMMDVVLPCQSLSLNVFEPRYRLLIRRCMEGSRRFGMVGYDQHQGRMCSHAVEVGKRFYPTFLTLNGIL